MNNQQLKPKKDQRPEGGGEYFSDPTFDEGFVDCCVCGRKPQPQGPWKRFPHKLLKGHTRTTKSAARIAGMFRWGAVAYDEYDRQTPKVVLGACPNHEIRLHFLEQTIRENKGVINQDIVDSYTT